MIGIRHRSPRTPMYAIRSVAARLLVLVLAAAMPIACGPSDPVSEVRELQAAGRARESVEPARRLLDDRPDDPERLYLYGVALTGAARLTEAVWPLRRAMESPDWYARAALQLASVAITTNDWDMAIEVLDELLEREPGSDQALLMRAYGRVQSRLDYEGALADADAVLERNRESSDALTLRAVALLGLERIDEAGEAIEAASAHFESAGLGLAESPRFCAVRATFAKEKKDFEAAEEIFGDCLERFPINALVVDEAVKFFGQRGRADRSLEILRTAFEGAPQVRTYRLSLVRHLLLAGEEEEAEKLMLDATAVEQPAAAAAAFSDLAGYYFEREKLDEAVSAFEEAMVRVPEPGPDFLFAFADSLVAAGRYDRALALANRMTVVPHRELIRGRVALERGSPREALEHLTKGISLWPDNAVARRFAASAAEQIGDFDRAIEEYRYSIRADAGASDARSRLARLYLAQDEAGPALEVLQHDVERKPHTDLAAALFELELLARLGRANVMPQHVASLIRPPEAWARAVVALADGTRARSGSAAAAELVLRADRLNLSAPWNAPALSSVVLDLIAAGRSDEAFDRLGAALRAHPKSADFRALEGLALSRSGGDAGRARIAWNRALELDPENAVALRGLAGLEAARGDVEAALDLYRRAAAADPEDTAALSESAELLSAAGRADEAEREFGALLQRDPYDGVAALSLARLLQRHPEASRDDARIAVLLRGAVRFGAGAEAESLLESIERGEAAGPEVGTSG